MSASGDDVSECAAELDGARLFREAGVLLIDVINCVCPAGHTPPHKGPNGELWGDLWTKHGALIDGPLP